MTSLLRMAVLAIGLTAPLAGQAASVAITCGSVGIEYRLCQEGAEAWAAETGHTVELVPSPGATNDRLALFQQLLAAGSPDIDVFQVDVIWPGILGRHLIDLRPHLDQSVIEAHFPALIENNTVDGQLKALPWFADVGLLYYRRDLLEEHGRRVPETWDELAEAARIVVAAEPEIAGYVFQGKAYEGLTCNALEWLDSHGAGILAEDGAVIVDSPDAQAALTKAASWIGVVAPPGVLGYAEEEARGVFQSGRAVFMRNWPYAWALANDPDSPVKGRVGVAPLPRGGAEGKHSGTLGGWGLAVSRYSRHPEIAADLVRWLASPSEQARRARFGAFNPTLPALYADPELLRERPLLAELLPILEAAVARPSRIAGDRYNQLSTIFWNAVHDSLAGRAEPAAALEEAAQRLRRLSRGGRW